MKRRWKWKVGPHGATVTVGERSYGGPIYLSAYDYKIGGTRRQSLGFAVRDIRGKLIEANVEKAKRAAAEVSNRRISGESPDKNVTARELFRLFRENVVTDMSDYHKYETLRELELWERFLGPSFPIGRLGVREWAAFKRERASGQIDARGNRVATGRSVGPRTVEKSLKALRHACRFGSQYRKRDGAFLLDADPTRGLPLPSEPNPKRPMADDHLLEQLLAVADQVSSGKGGDRSDLRELLILSAHTGRRIGAIVALRFSDWFPDEGSFGFLRWRADSDKLGREWKAPVTPEVRGAIEGIGQERPGVGDAWLFPAPKSKGHLRVDVARKWLRKAEALAELEHEQGFGWHSFRRMFASKRKHLSPKDVAALGGWKDTQTLQKLYQQADPETMESVLMNARPLRMKARG